MSEDTSPRLSLPLLAAGQAQKEMWVNEALQRLDALVQPVAQSADLTTPPASAEPGACWIVAAGATGLWAGQDDAIAQWTSSGWRFVRPLPGWRYRVADQGCAMIYADDGWREDIVRPSGIYIEGVKVIGSRMPAIDGPDGGAVIDSQARAAIHDLLAAIRAHGLVAS